MGRTVLGLCTSAIIMAFVVIVVVQLAFFGAASPSNGVGDSLAVTQHTSRQADLVAWASESRGPDEERSEKLDLLYLPPHPGGLYNYRS